MTTPHTPITISVTDLAGVSGTCCCTAQHNKQYNTAQDTAPQCTGEAPCVCNARHLLKEGKPQTCWPGSNQGGTTIQQFNKSCQPASASAASPSHASHLVHCYSRYPDLYMHAAKRNALDACTTRLWRPLLVVTYHFIDFWHLLQFHCSQHAPELASRTHNANAPLKPLVSSVTTR